MKKLQTIILSTLTAFALLIAPVAFNVSNAGAVCDSTSTAKQCAQDGIGATSNCDTVNPKPANCSLQVSLKNVVNVLLYVLGAIAVIMIVIGGIRYTTSNGDASGITSAKNTILYSVVGLIVALLAYAIVNFVLTSFA